jgi:hypothetical protein
MLTLTEYKNIPHQDVARGWREIGGKRIYFRSKWECNYSRYLEYQKENKLILDWFHEPQTFWFEKIKRGCRSYLPDFKVINLDSSVIWFEVKGYYDAKSKTKIKRFAKYYPEETLILIDGTWFSKNNKMMRVVIKDWE